MYTFIIDVFPPLFRDVIREEKIHIGEIASY